MTHPSRKHCMKSQRHGAIAIGPISGADGETGIFLFIFSILQVEKQFYKFSKIKRYILLDFHVF